MIGAGSEGTTPETASHSPEIVEGLHRLFPPGSSSKTLQNALRREGFKIQHCTGDRAVKYARFDQSGGNGITSMAATGIIYWKADADATIVWTTGDIAFRGL